MSPCFVVSVVSSFVLAVVAVALGLILSPLGVVLKYPNEPNVTFNLLPLLLVDDDDVIAPAATPPPPPRPMVLGANEVAPPPLPLEWNVGIRLDMVFVFVLRVRSVLSFLIFVFFTSESLE